MKVKTVLKFAAENIGEDELAKYFSGEAADDLPTRKEESGAMLSAYMRALSECASDYEPLYKKEKHEGKEIYFSSLSDRPLEILSVEDETGRPLEYDQFYDRLALAPPANSAVVGYRYIPEERGEDDELDYGVFARLTPRVIAMGTASEYLYARGDKSGALEMRQKFMSGVRGCLMPNKKLVLPRRKWL